MLIWLFIFIWNNRINSLDVKHNEFSYTAQPPGFLPKTTEQDMFNVQKENHVLLANQRGPILQGGYHTLKNAYSTHLQTFGNGYTGTFPAVPTVQQEPTCTFQRDDDCFGRSLGCAVKNAMPFERRALMSLEQCKSCCLSYVTNTFACESFVHDKVHQLCDMFAHRGDHAPSILHPTPNRDYYEVIGTKCRISKQPTMISTTAAISNLPVVRPVVTSNFKLPKTQCQHGFAIMYYKIVDHQVASGVGTEVNHVTDEQCINMCTSNQDYKRQPLSCGSFDFYPNEHKCIIYSNDSTNGEMAKKSGVHHFLKTCLPDQSSRCHHIILQQPHKVLIGYSRTVLEIEKLQDCVSHCLNSKTMYGYTCHSGVFYHEKDVLNCILNSETRDKYPDLFIDEPQSDVEYFQLHCDGYADQVSSTSAVHEVRRPLMGMVATQQPNAIIIAKEIANDWTLWSPCDKVTNVRKRYQVCDKIDIRECPQQQELCSTEEVARRRFYDYTKLDMQNDNSSCTYPTCCPVFGSCKVGVQRMSNNRLVWCPNPC